MNIQDIDVSHETLSKEIKKNLFSNKHAKFEYFHTNCLNSKLFI